MSQAGFDSGSFVQRSGEFVDAHGLFAPRCGVVVAVSGGADSVALLAALRELAAQPTRAYRLVVAHLNHCLRDDADADEAFVAELAKSWQLTCASERRDVRAEAHRLGEGIEQAARMLRYDFLLEVARGHGCQVLAMGHHCNDNVETILYRIIRGTHLRGLTGIPAQRTTGRDGTTIVRPLLWADREQIEQFCRSRGLAWRTDATNAEVSYRRNWIRHELMPLLRDKLNGRADEALLRLAGAAAEAEDYLVAQAEVAYQRALRLATEQRIVMSARSLSDEPHIIRSYVLRLALESLGVPMRMISAQRLSELADVPSPTGPVAITLAGGFAVRREIDEVILEHEWAEPPAAQGLTDLNVPGRTQLADGRTIICTLEQFDARAFETHSAGKNEGNEWLDADKVCGRLTARPRVEGDSFVPLGSPGRQSVSDFLTNIKLPHRQRERVFCICDDLGIIYLAPLRIDDRVKVTPATQRVLHVEITPPLAG